MQLLESVLAERVVKAFRNDQKVKLVGSQWPDTSPEQIAQVRKAGRPVSSSLVPWPFPPFLWCGATHPPPTPAHRLPAGHASSVNVHGLVL